MIYKFQPFSVTKELGKEYNAHCAIVPNLDDWILILDYDAMILTPQTYKVIETAIARYPDTGIFGAIGSRVGFSFQRHGRDISENDSILYHKSRAEDFAETFATGICRDAPLVAGMFMLFRKSYWINNPFQENIVDSNGKNFDFNFCQRAIRERKPMRIIMGAYIWHTYRLGSENYMDKSHLYGSH